MNTSQIFLNTILRTPSTLAASALGAELLALLLLDDFFEQYFDSWLHVLPTPYAY